MGKKTKKQTHFVTQNYCRRLTTTIIIIIIFFLIISPAEGGSETLQSSPEPESPGGCLQHWAWIQLVGRKLPV